MLILAKIRLISFFHSPAHTSEYLYTLCPKEGQWYSAKCWEWVESSIIIQWAMLCSCSVMQSTAKKNLLVDCQTLQPFKPADDVKFSNSGPSNRASRVLVCIFSLYFLLFYSSYFYFYFFYHITCYIHWGNYRWVCVCTPTIMPQAETDVMCLINHLFQSSSRCSPNDDELFWAKAGQVQHIHLYSK